MPLPLHATADIPAQSCSHLKEITQFSNEVWKSKHTGGEGNGQKSGSSEGVLCMWLLLIAASWLAVLIVRYGGPWGLAQKCGPGRRTSVRVGDRFSKQGRSRCTNITDSPGIQFFPLAPVDGSPIEVQQRIFPKTCKIRAFSGSGRTEWGKVSVSTKADHTSHSEILFPFCYWVLQKRMFAWM